MGTFGGWKIDILETAITISVNLNLKLAIVDKTKDKRTTLLGLVLAIERQMKKSYQISYQTFITFPFSSFNNKNSKVIKSGLDGYPNRRIYLPVKKTVNVSFSMQSRIIRNPDQKMNNEHLLQIKDNDGEMKNIYGHAHGIGGSVVSLNVAYVNNIIADFDNNTINSPRIWTYFITFTCG